MGRARDTSVGGTREGQATGAAAERPTRVGAPGLRRALDAAGMVAWEWDLATGRVAWAGARALWGARGGDGADGGEEDLLAAVHPDDRAAVRRARDEAAAGSGDYRCEYRVLGPGGQARWLESRGRVERGPDGAARRIVGVSLDVTDRRRAEAALGESEARYRAVVEGRTEFIVRLRPDGTLSFVNDAYCRHRGLPREVLLAGFDDVAHYPPDQRAKIRAAWAGLSPERPTVVYELEGPDAAAGVRHEEWADAGIFDAEGRLVEVQAVGRDITRRRRAELALAQGEARLRAVVEGIAEAVVAVFPKEGLWLRNAAWLPLHGFGSFDELPGRAVAAFAHLFETRSPDGTPVPSRDLPIARVLRGEGFSDVEVRLRRVDTGHERWVSYNGSAVRDPDGTVALAILTMRDVTARREAEERQRLLLDELSHRVKNTLAVVQGIARQSLAGDRAPGEAREALAKRLRALGRAHELLTASGWRGASLREVAATELAPYRGRASAEGEELVLAPKAAQALALVLHELATNAAKHGALSAPGGTVELRWSVGGGAGGRALRLSWRERGGPPVREPARRGFGRTLVEQAPAHDLGGRARLAFRPEGLEYELEAPLPEAGT